MKKLLSMILITLITGAMITGCNDETSREIIKNEIKNIEEESNIENENTIEEESNDSAEFNFNTNTNDWDPSNCKDSESYRNAKVVENFMYTIPDGNYGLIYFMPMIYFKDDYRIKYVGNGEEPEDGYIIPVNEYPNYQHCQFLNNTQYYGMDAYLEELSTQLSFKRAYNGETNFINNVFPVSEEYGGILPVHVSPMLKEVYDANNNSYKINFYIEYKNKEELNNDQDRFMDITNWKALYDCNNSFKDSSIYDMTINQYIKLYNGMTAKYHQ